MKNTRFLLFTILFCADFFCMQAQPLKLSWAKQMGGVKDEGTYAVELDQAGNIYTAGWFQGIADFDPGPNVYNLTSYGWSDMAICKYDALGSLVWTRSIGGQIATLFWI